MFVVEPVNSKCTKFFFLSELQKRASPQSGRPSNVFLTALAAPPPEHRNGEALSANRCLSDSHAFGEERVSVRVA
jgi:hypothetical protein